MPLNVCLHEGASRPSCGGHSFTIWNSSDCFKLQTYPYLSKFIWPPRAANSESSFWMYLIDSHKKYQNDLFGRGIHLLKYLPYFHTLWFILEKNEIYKKNFEIDRMRLPIRPNRMRYSIYNSNQIAIISISAPSSNGLKNRKRE